MVAFLISISTAKAEYLEDVKNFGYISGTGIACNASRYKIYETIARAYLLSAARSDKEQADGMVAYNTAKAEAFISKRDDGLWDCDDLNRRFDKQKIFKTKVYKNGTLKMPDGKIIKPRRAYDVTLVYDRDSNEREWLNELYDKNIEQQRIDAKEQGIFEKIRRAEAMGVY
jgi:hypothetical protein